MVENKPDRTPNTIRSPEQAVPPFLQFAFAKQVFGGGTIYMLGYESTGEPVNLRDPLPDQAQNVLLHPDFLMRYVRTESGIWEIGIENAVRYLSIPKLREGKYDRLELGTLTAGTAQLEDLPQLTIRPNEGIDLPEQNERIQEILIATTQPAAEGIPKSKAATITMIEKPNYYHSMHRRFPDEYPL